MNTQNAYQYTAIFEPAIEGGFNVSFPALPGCVTFGRTLAQAKEMAKDVLGLWIEELLSEKKKLPTESRKPFVDNVEVAIERK